MIGCFETVLIYHSMQWLGSVKLLNYMLTLLWYDAYGFRLCYYDEILAGQ